MYVNFFFLSWEKMSRNFFFEKKGLIFAGALGALSHDNFFATSPFVPVKGVAQVTFRGHLDDFFSLNERLVSRWSVMDRLFCFFITTGGRLKTQSSPSGSSPGG